MGSILSVLQAMREHWAVCLLVLGGAVVNWVCGYLRGYRAGEAAEMDRRYQGALSVNRQNESLRERIDFLQAENDALHRQVNPPRLPKTTDVEVEAFGLSSLKPGAIQHIDPSKWPPITRPDGSPIPEAPLGTEVIRRDFLAAIPKKSSKET